MEVEHNINGTTEVEISIPKDMSGETDGGSSSDRGSSSDKMIMPSINADGFISKETLGQDVRDLNIDGMDELLLGDEVGTTLVKVASELESPAYMIDMREVRAFESVFTALKAMLGPVNINGIEEPADTAVYIRTVKGLLLMGKGNSYRLYNLMEEYIRVIFGKACQVYKDCGDGNGFTAIKQSDVSFVRLDI